MTDRVSATGRNHPSEPHLIQVTSEMFCQKVTHADTFPVLLGKCRLLQGLGGGKSRLLRAFPE